MAGYFWAMLKNADKPVSTEFVRYRRKEQIRWLSEYLRKIVGAAWCPMSHGKHRKEGIV